MIHMLKLVSLQCVFLVECFVTDVAGIRFLPSMYSQMPLQAPSGGETFTAVRTCFCTWPWVEGVPKLLLNHCNLNT